MKNKIRTKALSGGLLVLLALSFTIMAKAGPSGKPDMGHRDEGVIFGHKFSDLNSNGRDDRDPRISGVTILLNGLDDPSVTDSTVTDQRGEFIFRGLPRQTYSVCEVAIPPLVPTTPECVEVSLFGKRPEARVIFGNHIPTPTPSPSVTPSPNPSVSPSPSPSPAGCVRTQGFWGSSPAGQALVPLLVPGTMNLGSTAYTAAQLAQILDQATGGNALLILAHQLIATNLNILAGADGSAVAATIASANTAIGSLVIPPIGSDVVAPSSTLGQTMVSLAATLDAFNNGNLGVPHCP